MRLTSTLLLTLSLIFAQIANAAHGWSAVGDTHDHAHKFGHPADHALDASAASLEGEIDDCCHLVISCSAFFEIASSDDFFGQSTYGADYGRPEVFRQDGIGVAAEPPPPRF